MKDSTGYAVEVHDSGDPGYVKRIMFGHAATGLVRIEWVQARYGQVIPVNWSQVEYMRQIAGFYPMRYQVADAQNLIVAKALELGFEWLLLWEHDMLPQPDALMILNNYMRDGKVPVVSGLYWTRSRPAEPLVFKGRGNGAFLDWDAGDMIWCDGVPTGFLLIHTSILRAMWEEAEEYTMHSGEKIRAVFTTPRSIWIDEKTGHFNTKSGTSDLEWCTKVMEGGYFKKAGWPTYQEMKHPFLVETRLPCRHINPDGEWFPAYPVWKAYIDELRSYNNEQYSRGVPGSV